MSWINNVKAIIFDMDGTLYQDYTFLGRYINYLLEDILPDQEIKRNIDEAYSILEGNHPIRLGHFIDKQNFNVYAHDEFTPTTSFYWNGKEKVNQNATIGSFFFLGDPWGIANIYAEQYGVSDEVRTKAFEAVRTEMLQKPTEIVRHSPLFDYIAELNVEKKILMTNTPGVTGPAFVKHLQMDTLFDEVVFDAKKPVGMKMAVRKLLKEGYEPHEILSIGDNPYNDLFPVKTLGCKTCLISQYEHYGSNEWDFTVKTIEELAAFLSKKSAITI